MANTSATHQPQPDSRWSLSGSASGSAACVLAGAAALWATEGAASLALLAAASTGLGIFLEQIRRHVKGDGSTMTPDADTTDAADQTAAAIQSAPVPNAPTAARNVLLETCELLEADLDSTVAEIMRQSSTSVSRGRDMATQTQIITSEAKSVASAAEGASRNVASVANATEQLSATGREIGQQAIRTSTAARAAVGDAENAAATMNTLHQAAERIGEFVKTISDVAAKTNLLALNATIEAARAGEAGKGFAVVASEVKALSRQAANASEDIARRIQEIRAATSDSVAAIGSIGKSVREIEEASTGVAAAIEEQEAMVTQIAGNVSDTSADVARVADSIEAISQKTTRIAALAAEATEAVVSTDGRIGELRANLIVSLRASVAGDRREQQRVPVELRARIETAGRSIEVTLLDLSMGGAYLRSPQRLTERSMLTLHLDKVGAIPGEALATHNDGTHLKFADLTPELRERLTQRLAEITAADDPFIEAAKAAATRVGAAFEAALERGTITEEALFDDDYKPIPESDPPQHLAAFTTFAESVLPPLVDPLLAFDRRVEFSVAVDRNGYSPTHNPKSKQPQRRGDPAWNAQHARNRRVFNDRAGLTAARSTRDHVLQHYARDLGDGVKTVLKEADAPIKVRGRHWGAVRLGYRL